MKAIRKGRSMGGEQDAAHINSPKQHARELWQSHVAHDKSIRQDYLTKWPAQHEALWLNHVEQNNKNKIHIRQNATLVLVKTAPRTQPHRPTCTIPRCNDLVSEGTHELCLHHHNIQARHFFQRYSPAMRVPDLTRSPSDPNYLTLCNLTDPIQLRAGQWVIVNGAQ